ncbi:hypothetical protein AAFF_G00049350 [Aldrovandia affinis]|uniref:Uncharacterized protein n=1 Tax=Aldrovandia affinis TaxID=143900 RepID=A0AAD7S1F9_9TELE|nr:hypothetical protein AAFF_G00049350 [Aldrovandia affinis]
MEHMKADRFGAALELAEDADKFTGTFWLALVRTAWRLTFLHCAHPPGFAERLGLRGVPQQCTSAPIGHS